MNIEQQKERLLIEEKMLIEELSKIGLYDRETNTWNATHGDMPNEEIHDDDTQADAFEEIEENMATGEILRATRRRTQHDYKNRRGEILASVKNQVTQ